jgi:antitoxin HicB
MQGFAVIVKPDPKDGGFVATVPGLPGVVGHGETEEEALEDARAALEPKPESGSGKEFAADGDPDYEGARYPFDADESLEALAAKQGVEAADDFDALLGDFWPAEEAADDFVAALCEWRRAAPAA